jgi:hypothetical protein
MAESVDFRQAIQTVFSGMFFSGMWSWREWIGGWS